MDETNETIELEIESISRVDFPESVEEPPVSIVQIRDEMGFRIYNIPIEHVARLAWQGYITGFIGRDGLRDSGDGALNWITLELDKEGFQQLVEGEGGVDRAFYWLKYQLHLIFCLTADGKAIHSFTEGWEHNDVKRVDDGSGNVCIEIHN